MWGFYRLMTFFRPYYRPIGVPPKDEGAGVTNINETIDASVFERWRRQNLSAAGVAGLGEFKVTCL